MKQKIIIIICIIGTTLVSYGQMEVNMKIKAQTEDSLIVVITYFNKSSKKIVLDGFTGIDFEDYYPVLAQVKNKTAKNYFLPSKKGNVCDTIRMIMPETKENLRYQRLNNGDTLDVFDTYSLLKFPIFSSPPSPPELTENDSIDFSKFFLDEDVFNHLWKNNAWKNNEFFDNDKLYYNDYCYLVTIEPYSNKEILIDLSFLLKRKATYVLQICGKGYCTKSIDVKRIMKKKFGYKPYNKPLESNSIIIVSN